jgi:hypothetical protein
MPNAMVRIVRCFMDDPAFLLSFNREQYSYHTSIAGGGKMLQGCSLRLRWHPLVNGERLCLQEERSLST